METPNTPAVEEKKPEAVVEPPQQPQAKGKFLSFFFGTISLLFFDFLYLRQAEGRQAAPERTQRA